MSKLSLNIGLMLTINKVFGILCLLCLCWNREYPGSVQNKSLSSSFKWLLKYSVPGQAKGKAFLEWASTDLSFKLFFTCRGNVNYYKSVIILFLLCLWWHPGNFQNESASSPFSWVSRYVLFLAKVKVKRKPFWRVQEGWPHCEITNLLSEGMKNISFCKIWNNPAPPLSFIRPSYK